MPRIKILTPELANQIAAGEVIERPTSVIKELVENALDAGSTRIEITLEKGGKSLIRVRDNGKGIHAEDLALALTRHATSKIQSLRDLTQVQSLGFRGEALASISAISHLTLSSRVQGQQAYQARTSGINMDVSVLPTAHNDGTTIEVCDLFFNTPARRKFLRSDKTEFLHIEELVKRLSLSRFDVGFLLQHENQVLMDVKPATSFEAKTQRLTKVFGLNFTKHAVFVESTSPELQLHGWISRPSFSRSLADLQACYLNGRLVRDRLLNHAIRTAYGTELAEGRYCAYALYLHIDPEAIDVNVHPTKAEVRFNQSRIVHDFIVQSLQPALHTENNHLTYSPPTALGERLQVQAMTSHYSAAAPEPTTVSSYKLLTRQAHFLLLERENILWLVDLHRVLTEIFYQQFQLESIPSRALLIPLTATISPKLVSLCETQQPLLQNKGITLEPMTASSVVLRRLPLSLHLSAQTDFIHNLVKTLAELPADTLQAQHLLSQMLALVAATATTALATLPEIMALLQPALNLALNEAVAGIRQVEISHLEKLIYA